VETHVILKVVAVEARDTAKFAARDDQPAGPHGLARREALQIALLQLHGSAEARALDAEG
jgi:hypothetical protein